VSLKDGVSAALSSLLANRLSILAGAGLSMAPPSSLPSAAALAASARAKYEAKFGPAPFIDDIAQQADYFFSRSELVSVYLRTLIDKNAFAGPPNPGHYAVADLILVAALTTAVTTNIDTMIETAGQMIFGHVESGIDAASMALIPPEETPLLKIHGCRQADLANTIWSPLQLGDPAISARLIASGNWLEHRLANRDLLIVGYATDWDYLNGALGKVLGTIAPARVVIVDPSDAVSLTAKAPLLFGLGSRATLEFLHVRIPGDMFLDALRCAFSGSFIRQILHSGSQDYADSEGHLPDPAWLEPPALDSGSFWLIRRDLEGCRPRRPATRSKPHATPLLGMTLLQLRAAGAVPEGSFWNLAGRKIRVLRADGQALHRIQSEFDGDTAPVAAPDVVIAVGAEDLGLPAHLVRGGGPSTITRGAAGRWFTRSQAVDDLHL
jgi:hypothetical protein